MGNSRRTKKSKGIYRSLFEKDFAETLQRHGLTADYEADKLKYTQPAQERSYCPDWKIKDGFYIETKGRFTGADRKKMLWLRDSHPGITVYLLFMRSSVTLNKTSKTSYGDWCDKQGLPWSDIKDTRKWKAWFK